MHAVAGSRAERKTWSRARQNLALSVCNLAGGRIRREPLRERLECGRRDSILGARVGKTARANVIRPSILSLTPPAVPAVEQSPEYISCGSGAKSRSAPSDVSRRMSLASSRGY